MEHSVILSNKTNPYDVDDDFYLYQFNEYYTFYNDKLYEVALWCENNCNDAWLVGQDCSGFKDIDDVMAFKLTWS